MKLLGIETSSPVFSIAVSDGDQLLSFHHAEGAGKPSTGLTPLMEQALERMKWTFADLDGFAVSIGPGSFTGLRVGVTTVKTMAWALKKPVIPVSSLELIAQNLQKIRPREIRLFLDARKGKVYTARFSPGEDGFVTRMSEDRVMLPAEALEGIDSGSLLAGDGVRRYAELVEQKKLKVADPQSWIPRADVLCRLASRTFESARVDEPHTLVPQYLYSRKSDITGW